MQQASCLCLAYHLLLLSFIGPMCTHPVAAVYTPVLLAHVMRMCMIMAACMGWRKAVVPHASCCAVRACLLV